MGITARTIVDDFIHFRVTNILDIYRGLSFGIFEKFTFNGIYFFFYSALKNDWKRRYATPQRQEMPLWVALLRGSMAGILTQIFTSPLGTIQKILQTTHHEDADHANASSIISNIAQKHGLSALWSGFGMSMVLVINPAINVYCYDHIRSHLNVRLGLKSAAIDFMAGLWSKAIATVLCYPLIFIKYNQQATRKSVKEMIVSTMKEHGPGGFYKGLRTKLVQSSLSNALMFMIKEKMVIYTFAMMLYLINKRKQMGALRKLATTQP